MNAVLLNGGKMAGALGILVMLIAVLARAAGNYTLGGYATATLLLAGIGAVSVGCFLLLWVLAERARG